MVGRPEVEVLGTSGGRGVMRSMFQLNPRSAAVIIAAAALSACGLHGGAASVDSNRPDPTVEGKSVIAASLPDLNGQNIVTFAIAPPGMDVTTVAAGSDGNIWFAQMVPYIGRLASNGTVTEFAIPSGHFANDITPGANGTLWFSEFRASKIGRIAIDGTIKEFGGPRKLTFPSGLTLGSDGNIWFLDQRGFIGRMTPRGEVTEFGGITTPGNDITLGPDGNVWFTEGSDIGVITPSGQITNIQNPKGIDTELIGIVAGPDGNLYVGERGKDYKLFITQVTTAGVFTRFPSPSRIHELTVGPDNNIWATGDMGSTPVLSQFRLNTHTFSKPVPLPGTNAQAWDLTSAGGAVWFASGTGNYIGEYK